MIVKKIKTDEVNILGIDLSLNGTGIINLRSNRHNPYAITSKCKTILKNESWATLFNLEKINEIERLILIRDTIVNIINNVKPTYIALEDYSLGSTHSTINTGEVGGVIRVAIFESGIPLRLYEPTRVKKFTTGSGSAPKSAMCVNVYKRWNVDFSMYNDIGEDLADAYSLAKLLELELAIRKDKALLDKQPNNVKEIFLGVTKANKVPLIEKDFIKRG